MLRRVYRAIPVLLALALVAACASEPRIEFIPEGGSYTTEAAMTKANEVEIGPASRLTADEAPAARQRILASLRSRDAAGSTFASLMTETFETDTRSVPVYAEAAVIDGREAWIVVEAWGGRSGALQKRRIWILERDTGEVISSATAE